MCVCTLKLFIKGFLVLFSYFIDITNTYLGSNFSSKMNTYSQDSIKQASSINSTEYCQAS